MSTPAPSTARLDEIEAIPVSGTTLRWVPVRRHFGIRAFGVNAYTALAAGEDVVEDHTEVGNQHQELYVVVSGRALFTVAGEEVEAPAGTLVFIRDPSVRRGAKAVEPGTTVLAVGGKPGEAYEPSAWEHWFVAYAHADRGDDVRALEELTLGLAQRPDHPVLLYHLACFESRLGRKDEALGHLTRALELGDFLRENARSDPDLDPIRDDPRFPA